MKWRKGKMYYKVKRNTVPAKIKYLLKDLDAASLEDFLTLPVNRENGNAFLTIGYYGDQTISLMDFIEDAEKTDDEIRRAAHAFWQKRKENIN